MSVRSLPKRRFLPLVWLAVAAVALGPVTACSHSGASKDPGALAVVDPHPDGFKKTTTFESAGGEHADQSVKVSLPEGAVDGSATVSVGAEIGTVDNVFAEEVYGHPVRIEHDRPLLKPATVTWDVSMLTAEQQASIIVVKWDDSLHLWTAVDEDVLIENGSLTVATTGFSIIDWLSSGAATISQTVGQWIGKRSEAPDCPKNKDQKTDNLPSWVTTVVRPDETQPDRALRTCLEQDTGDVIAARIANNRPYSQMIQLTHGGDAFAWKDTGEQDFTVAGLVVGAVNTAMSDKSSMILPPVKTGAVGLARPTGSATYIGVDAQASWQTVMSDILFFVLSNLSITDNVQGFDSEAANTFAQVLYDCVGKAGLSTREPSVPDVVDALAGCADNDTVMNAIENVLRSEISKGGAAATAAVVSNRILKSALTKLNNYKMIADLSWYVDDLAADSIVGPTYITVNTQGRSAGGSPSVPATTSAPRVTTSAPPATPRPAPASFDIRGAWKSVGSTGWGQAQPGAIVRFGDAQANLYSPQDTYALYKDGGQYRLDVTGLLGGTSSFVVSIIDNDNIELYSGSDSSPKVKLKRVG